jgi:hypothetical protein
MIIDISKLKDRYIHLPILGGTEVVVKLDDEGIVVDYISDGEVQESTWKLYQEMIDGDGEEEAEAGQMWAIFGKHPIHDRVDLIDLTTAKKNEIHDNMVTAGYMNIKVLTMEDWKIIKGKK